MKNPFRILVMIVLLIIANSHNLFAQIAFVSENIKQVYSNLPQSIKEQVLSAEKQIRKASYHKLNFKGEHVEIVVRYNNYNEIEHIGLFVFDENNGFSDMREVLDFTERLLLISALSGNENFISEEYIKDSIVVNLNGTKVKLRDKQAIIQHLGTNKTSEFNIRRNSEAFMLSWKLAYNKVFTIKIPNNYSVITGQTKDELEKNLLRKIKSSKTISIDKTLPVKSQLSLINGSIYKLLGQIYSTTPELTSTKYYQVTSEIVPVFEKAHYKESISNLFLNLINSSLRLKMVHKMYGGTDEKYVLKINNLYSNFANDFDICFGWQNDNRENLKASIFFSHKTYNYNHLLVINTSVNTVFKKDGEIDGIFMTFIPREKLIGPDSK